MSDEKTMGQVIKIDEALLLLPMRQLQQGIRAGETGFGGQVAK